MAINSETSELSLNELLKNSLDGIFVIDRECRYVLFSDGCERITGYSRGSVIGTECSCHELTDCHDEHGRSLAGTPCPGLGIFRGEVPTARQRLAIRRHNGQTVWVETTYSPMYDEDGSVAYVVGILRDMTAILARDEQILSMTGDTVAADFDTTIGTLDSLTKEGSGMNSRDASGEAGNRPLDEVLTSIERREILAALRRANGQRTLAAQLLRISRSRLYRRMEALGIDPRKLGPHGEV